MDFETEETAISEQDNDPFTDFTDTDFPEMKIFIVYVIFSCVVNISMYFLYYL